MWGWKTYPLSDHGLGGQHAREQEGGGGCLQEGVHLAEGTLKRTR